MTYTAITKDKLRAKPGTITDKLATEFAAIKTEYDTVTASHTTSLAAGAKVAKILSPGAAMNAYSFNWQNPETTKIIIWKAVFEVYDNENIGNGAQMNIGSASGSGVEGDNLLDGVSIETAGLFDNVTNKGTNGLPQITVDENGGATDWVTGKVVAATGANYAGVLYLFYTKVVRPA